MNVTFSCVMNKAEPTLALKPRGDITRNPNKQQTDSSLASKQDMTVADLGGGGARRPCKNMPKKEGRRTRQLVFHVSWPSLSKVSGSATA